MFTLFYYCFIKPISLLPSWLLYGISDSLSFILFHGGLYRKSVVVKQITASFPEKSPNEVLEITRKFYSHFCDLMVESLMIFSISREEAIQRCRITGEQVFTDLFAENKNIIIAGGHYNNWEMLAVAIDEQIPHQAMALYTTLANQSINRLMKESRSKYGLQMYPKKRFWEIFEAKDGPLFAAVFGADQFPTKSKNVFWTTFLNQETCVAFGTEKYAVEQDCAVVFGRIIKVKRGCYQMDFELITKDATKEPFGAITKKHVALLEADIKKHPEFWLWTHRRWKRSRPVDQPIH
ncbi:MAG: lysophospholipid acyltransferase family protein [Imperialibacter sp.]|uniref:lysophospholipid acyltransferase family protein n=1 Tax=Imperialibacter sp. TaxID=2038411 RepID=UPI0032EBF206